MNISGLNNRAVEFQRQRGRELRATVVLGYNEWCLGNVQCNELSSN